MAQWNAFRVHLAMDTQNKGSHMYTNPNEMLTAEGLEELDAVASERPADTPERRATFERARAAARFVRQEIEQTKAVQRGR